MHEGNILRSTSSSAKVPPEFASYLGGPGPESRQFDFLIGEWDVAATRFHEDGSTQFQYQATWSAMYLNEGRMIMDDFKTYAPSGQAISSYVTLRTYSQTTRRWEMVGLAALQPAARAEWTGVLAGNEMLLDAAGMNADGSRIRTRIRFTDIGPHRFVWESKTSRDDGKTWVPTASLIATRSPL